MASMASMQSGLEHAHALPHKNPKPLHMRAPTLALLGRRSKRCASRSASTSAFLRLLTFRVPEMTALMKRTRLLMRSSSASAACADKQAHAAHGLGQEGSKWHRLEAPPPQTTERLSLLGALSPNLTLLSMLQASNWC